MSLHIQNIYFAQLAATVQPAQQNCTEGDGAASRIAVRCKYNTAVRTASLREAVVFASTQRHAALKYINDLF